jgi:TAG lipase / steryl ester hydrolase / phospholipase A2 / LPA acyltransferase
MRTASANKFISFIQNLEIDTKFKTIPPREDITDLVTPNAGTLVSHAVSRGAIDRSFGQFSF